MGEGQDKEHQEPPAVGEQHNPQPSAETLWCVNCDIDIGQGDARQFAYAHITAGHKLEVRKI
jgi:hypothetical protein